MRSTQRAAERCTCGGVTDVSPTKNPRLFHWLCQACKASGVFAWATVKEPPRFEANHESTQIALDLA